MKPFKTLIIFVCSILVFSAFGCSVEPSFEYASSNRHANIVELDTIQIEFGTALAIRVLEDNEELPHDMSVNLYSDDESILGIDPTDEFDVFVLYGMSHGETTATLTLDGEVFGPIPAVVR